MTAPARRSRRWPRPTDPREARHETWLLVGLLLLGVVLPVVVGAIAGSLEIPRNDDWSYRRIALELARTGRLAVIPVLLLVVFPGYLAYATSYMSDVPAAAAEFACLALGAIALARRPVPAGWLLAAVAVGFLAFSIRDFAVAAP